MPLGFSIIGSTVAFDLFLRWATQGPLGPLVLTLPLVKMSCFHISPLSHCSIRSAVILLFCHTSMLSHCISVTLLFCHTYPLSHFSTVTPDATCVALSSVYVCPAFWDQYVCNLVCCCQEIVTALESQCNIIPILDNCDWPEPEQLPEDMRQVCYFNGIRYGLQEGVCKPDVRANASWVGFIYGHLLQLRIEARKDIIITIVLISKWVLQNMFLVMILPLCQKYTFCFISYQLIKCNACILNIV